MKKQKPYFSTEQVDKITQMFSSGLLEDGIEVTDAIKKSLREYIQSPKHMYENACLHGVIDGLYLCTIKNGNQIAYKAAPIPDEEVQAVVDSARATEELKGEPNPTKVPTFGQVQQVLHQKRVALNTASMAGEPKVLSMSVN
jgi:hypothetical protein